MSSARVKEAARRGPSEDLGWLLAYWPGWRWLDGWHLVGAPRGKGLRTVSVSNIARKEQAVQPFNAAYA
jgi:hypothetical protein